MANNGARVSYIIVGVSDDGRQFKSVTNAKLSDDRLQAFCKHTIFPPPKVRLERVSFPEASAQIAGKEFVAIKVGPNRKSVFRLNQDFIRYEESMCYRRNEVWLRRGATSDLATPEEIGLLLKGKDPSELYVSSENIDYTRLPASKKSDTIIAELSQILSEVGGFTSAGRVVLPVRGLNFVFRFLILNETTSASPIYEYISRSWQYEHGYIFIVIGTVSKKSLPEGTELKFKEDWGWFCTYPVSAIRYRSFYPPRLDDGVPLIPLNIDMSDLVILTLPKISSTKALRNAIVGLKEFLGGNDQSYHRIKEARSSIIANLRRWLSQGWIEPTNTSYVGGRPKPSDLRKDEFFDRRISNTVLRRHRSSKAASIAQSILDLSLTRRK